MVLDPVSVSISILLSTLPLLPVLFLLLLPLLSMLSIRCYCRLDLQSVDSAQNTVGYCCCSVLTLELFSSRFEEQFGSALLFSCVASRLMAFLLQSVSLHQSIYFLSSMRRLLIRYRVRRHCLVNRSDLMWQLVLVDTVEGSCFAMLFFLLLLPSKTLLSFLLPINTTSFFVVLALVIVLDSILIACSSCRSCYQHTLVTLLVLWVDIQEGFSIRVGCSTNCTQHLFRDHFFLAKYCSRLFYRSRCCSSTATSSFLDSILFCARRDSVDACYLVD